MKRLTVKKKLKKNKILNPPGSTLQRQIQTGEPPLMGLYLVFIKRTNDAWDHMPMAEPEIAYFDGYKWNRKAFVVGWVGPLPNMSLDELQEHAPDKAPITLFFISTLKLMKKTQRYP